MIFKRFEMGPSAIIGFLLSAILVLMSPATQAAAPEWRKDWRCGKEVSLKQANVRYLRKHKKIYAYSLNGNSLPILIAQDFDGLGVLLFTQINGKWRAYPFAKSSLSMGVWSTASYFRISLFAMAPRERRFKALSIKSGLRHIHCNHIDFRSLTNLGKSALPSIQDFNVTKRGDGSLLAASYVLRADGQPGKLSWFRYRSHDWGYNWGKPGPVKPPKAKDNLKGVFSRAKETVATWRQVASLLKQAK